MRRYTTPAIALHWLIAALIFGGFTLGWIMTEMNVSPQKLQFFSWHKWIGVTVFALALMRVLWRLGHTPPPLLPAPLWQQRAALAMHALFYALMFAIPLSGWTFSSASGYQTVYLGVLPLPDLVDKNKELAAALKKLHLTLNYSMAVLVFLHAAAALKHHFVDKDNTLKRILPWKAHA